MRCAEGGILERCLALPDAMLAGKMLAGIVVTMAALVNYLDLEKMVAIWAAMWSGRIES